MDPYEMLRQLSFTTTPGFQMDPELGGGMSPDFYNLNMPQGFQTKFGGNLTQSADGLFETRFQAPGGDKYDLLQAQYKIDPATGQATMVGDPSQIRQASSGERLTEAMTNGAALMAAVMGGGALGSSLAGAGAAGGGLGAIPSTASMPSFAGLSSLPTIGPGLGAAGVGAAGAVAGAAAPAAASGGFGGLLSGLGSAIANNPLQAAAIGLGAIGGAQGQGEQTATTQSRTDPRIDPHLYGDQGVLKAASDWYGQNKSGANDTMRAGWNQQLGLLQDPRTMQGLQGLQQSAQGLLGTRIAGNPFMRG